MGQKVKILRHQGAGGVLQRFYQRLGIAGLSLVLMTAFVITPVVIYYATGMGEVPPIEMAVKAQDDSIVLIVLDGRIPASDWEYLVFDERLNPPVVWAPAPADMKPGAEIALKSNLTPSTYRVQIRHIPTAKFILDDKVTIK